MSTQDFYLTPEGINDLKTELDDLVKNKRKEVANALKEAKDFGDLSENSGWDDAKEKQAFIEGRIAEINNILKRAKTIEKVSSDTIGVGSKVQVTLDGGTQTFHIVGSTEVDLDTGKISHESPIGKALLGKKVGDTAEVEVPAGTITYKITKLL
ncbi:MAG: transcription elongation factor GreA [Candidatus Saccharibacteria bacterium]